MTIGGFDLEKFAQGPLNWHNASRTSDYWTIEGDSISIEFSNSKNKTELFKNIDIVVDTGTSYMLLPMSQADRVLQIVKENL